MLEDLHKIDFLNGVIRFNELFLLLDLFLLIHFFYSYYLEYKKCGWKIDPWNVFMIQLIVIPFFLLYPFNSSIYNVISVADEYVYIDKFVEKSFFITVTGYLSMLLGKKIYEYRYSPEKIEKFGLIERIIYSNIRYPFGMRIVGEIVILSLILLLVIELKNDLLFNGRLFFQMHIAYRSLGNGLFCIVSYMIIYLGIRIILYKENKDKKIFFLIMVLSVFIGVRGVIVAPLLGVFCLYYYFNRDVSFVKITLFGTLILVVVFTIGFLRNSNGNVAFEGDLINIFIIDLLYGNTFSDNRDFAWILSCFDEKYVGGMTYLSGVLSFIPSGFWDFRKDWSVGAYSVKLVGLDSTLHQGLRGGIFAESYLNFGYAGPLVIGIIGGYYLKHADVGMKYFVMHYNDITKGYIKSILFFFVSNFFISVGFFSIYVFLALHIILIIINTLKENLREN